MKRSVVISLILAIFLFLDSAAAEEAKKAIIYKNEACGHCNPYIDELYPVLAELGYGIEIKEFINSPEVRKELSELQDSFGVPLQYRGHMLVFVEGKHLFEGHVPVEVIGSFLLNPSNESVIIYQDSMDEANTYFIVSGDVAFECSITTPVLECDGSSDSKKEENLWNHPFFLPILILLVPVALIAKYGLK